MGSIYALTKRRGAVRARLSSLRPPLPYMQVPAQFKYSLQGPFHNSRFYSYYLQRKLLGKEHPDPLKGINNLAMVLGSPRKHEEAETCIDEHE